MISFAAKVWFAFISVLLVILCGINLYREATPAWKDYQRAYYGILARNVADPVKAETIRATPPRFRQIYNEDLGVVDRCVICHLGIDNPAMTDVPNPYARHPGRLFESHPPSKIGCTLCHEGQGRATTRAAAFGEVAHWEKPLLTGDFVQASCPKCHREDEIPAAPVLSRGKRLLRELGCMGCHVIAGIEAPERIGPDLTGVGSKVNRRWLQRWLAGPRSWSAAARMPDYHFVETDLRALSAYLETFRDPRIDEAPQPPEGDPEVGGHLFRQSRCVSCHALNGRGGTIGPDLGRIGNKTTARWLAAWIADPQAHQPATKMPRFHFSQDEIADIVAYLLDECTDWDLLDEDEESPPLPPPTEEDRARGAELFRRYGCGGCHANPEAARREPIGPELTFVGSKRPHELGFGTVAIPHTLPDFLFMKLKKPRDFGLTLDTPPLRVGAAGVLDAILRNVRHDLVPADLPADATTDARLEALLERARATGAVEPSAEPPREASALQRSLWLLARLNQARAFDSLRMPDFGLTDRDAEALTVALLSLSESRIASAAYEVRPKPRRRFVPQGELGRFFRTYRCLSCHAVYGQGGSIAPELGSIGSKVKLSWLRSYLRLPYTIRPLQEERMPLFHFTDEEADDLADLLRTRFADDSIVEVPESELTAERAARGRELIDRRGCLACHILDGRGGYVGPSFTTGSPIGDKLTPGYLFAWLKDPTARDPRTLDPTSGLTDDEALDLTAFLTRLRAGAEGEHP